MKKNSFAALCSLCLLLLVGCSITHNLPDGELLYVGIGKTKVLHRDKSKIGAEALSEAEKAINVPPNDALFGSARYRLPFHLGLWAYNRYRDDSTFLGRKMYKIFASEPVLLSDVTPGIRAELARNILREHGYFDAEVNHHIYLSRKDSLEAYVAYTIDMGKPYAIKQITHIADSSVIQYSGLNLDSISPLKVGQQFNFERVLEDRLLVSNFLRNRGYYYYTPQALLYQVDTTTMQGIDMRIVFKPGLDTLSLRPWTIHRVTYNIDTLPKQQLVDSVVLDNITFRYNQKPKVSLPELKRRIFLSPGDLYSQEREKTSRQALARLGAFASTDLSFSIADSARHLLNLHIYSIPDLAWEASVEGVFKVKSNGFQGPGVSATLSKRNVFGRGETLSASLYGSYESQKIYEPQKLLLHSYEVGADVTFNTPNILLPSLYTHPLPFLTSTDITLSGSLLNRARYFRMMALGGSLTYHLNFAERHKHQFSPLKVHYNFLSNRTEEFDRILQQNTLLELSFLSQFIPQIGYTYTYDDIFESRGNHHIWLETSVAESGNLINGFFTLANANYNTTKKLFGVPFAQFAKLTAELHYTYAFSNNQSLATRLASGVIYSYGNSSVAPFSEQFYVGGANSIRAFTVRSIGPGSYIPKTDRFSFIDQSGDFKLELNAEWRIRLLKALHAALFLDAGNIWLLRPDPNRPGASLPEVETWGAFFKQMALGTGFGLRYDLGYFVVRSDVGIGLHLPYATDKRGYYNIPNFLQSTAFHLAIGYPF